MWLSRRIGYLRQFRTERIWHEVCEVGVLTVIRPMDGSISSFVVRNGRYSHPDIRTTVRTDKGELCHVFSGAISTMVWSLHVGMMFRDGGRNDRFDNCGDSSRHALKDSILPSLHSSVTGRRPPHFFHSSSPLPVLELRYSFLIRSAPLLSSLEYLAVGIQRTFP